MFNGEVFLGLFNLFRKDCKRGIANEYLIWILIAVAVLAIVVIGLLVFKGEGISLIDRIKELIS